MMRKVTNILPPKRPWVLLILFLYVGFAYGQEQTKRVLFVGNSFIYFFNMPQMVSSMAESQGIEIITRQSTVGGSNLEQHWKSEKGTQTRRLLEEQKWDYVVFNNHSLSAIETPESFHLYGRKFADLVREKEAIPVFMSTWGYKSNPLLLDRITPAYQELVTASKSLIVPVGSVIDHARKRRPDLNLYQDDKHLSPEGTYLVALTFYKFFTGKSTADILPRLTTLDEDDELLYLCFLSESDADFLQNLVDDFEFELTEK